MKKSIATFAAGCFWGVQDDFDKTDGVISTKVGYINGVTLDPTYELVCAGGTGHIEAVQVEYDSEKVSYAALLEIFLKQVGKIAIWILDYPTGQYLPMAFWHTDEQRQIIEEKFVELARSRKGVHTAKIAKFKKAGKFWPELDESHQHYCQKNPDYKH